MEFYARMQATANKLLKGKGQAVTLTRQVSGAYDPATGQATITTTIQTGTGAIFDYGIQQAGIYSAPGSLIQVGDKQLLLSVISAMGGLLTAPEVNDTVTVGTTVYTIKQVKALSPAGTTVLFDINLRGVA